jgi:hypothetical protein
MKEVCVHVFLDIKITVMAAVLQHQPGDKLS